MLAASSNWGGLCQLELPLSQQDVGCLDNTVRERLRQDPRLGTRFLVRKAPLAFGVYLVWQEIRFNQDGDYWSAVHASTGVADPGYQSVWGRCFLRTLRKHGLLTVEGDRGPAFVGPILFQGGVPDLCLPEYFREVAWKYFVGRGWTAGQEIRDALRRWRVDAHSCPAGTVSKRGRVVARRRRRGEWPPGVSARAVRAQGHSAKAAGAPRSDCFAWG